MRSKRWTFIGLFCFGFLGAFTSWSANSGCYVWTHADIAYPQPIAEFFESNPGDISACATWIDNNKSVLLIDWLALVNAFNPYGYHDWVPSNPSFNVLAYDSGGLTVGVYINGDMRTPAQIQNGALLADYTYSGQGQIGATLTSIPSCYFGYAGIELATYTTHLNCSCTDGYGPNIVTTGNKSSMSCDRASPNCFDPADAPDGSKWCSSQRNQAEICLIDFWSQQCDKTNYCQGAQASSSDCVSFAGGGTGPNNSDTDGDGVTDPNDNCIAVHNAAQTDTDGDGVGDACDETPNGPDPTNTGNQCGAGRTMVDTDCNGVADLCVNNTEVANFNCGGNSNTGDGDAADLAAIGDKLDKLDNDLQAGVDRIADQLLSNQGTEQDIVNRLNQLINANNSRSGTTANNCSGFSCSGDPIQCALLSESYRLRCNNPDSASVIAINGENQTGIAQNSTTNDVSAQLSGVMTTGPAGSCPSPRTMAVMNNSLELSYQPLCDFAIGLRPFLIAVAGLVSLRSIVGSL